MKRLGPASHPNGDHDLEIGIVDGDPEGLEKEPGQSEEEEDPEKGPVADHVRPALVLPRRAVRRASSSDETAAGSLA